MQTTLDTRAFTLGPVQVYPEGLEMRVGGKMVKLEPRVMTLLCYLAERPGQVLSKEQILKGVWGGTNVVEEALQRAISILRRKLKDNLDDPIFIETISKKGYRLLVEPGALSEIEGEDMNLTERNIKVSPLLLILAVLAGGLMAYAGWQLLLKEPTLAPAADEGGGPESDILPPVPDN